MKKLLSFIFIFVSLLTISSCDKEKKNSLELFLDHLEETSTFKIEASIKRDYPPKFDYYLNISYDHNKIYAESNYQIKNYGNSIYIDYSNEDELYAYYKKDDTYIKESITNDVLDVEVKSKITVDDFHINEDGEYELNENLLEKFKFVSATIEIIDNDNAQVKGYITYNYIEIPVYVNITNTNVNVTMPNV